MTKIKKCYNLKRKLKAKSDTTQTPTIATQSPTTNWTGGVVVILLILWAGIINIPTSIAYESDWKYETAANAPLGEDTGLGNLGQKSLLSTLTPVLWDKAYLIEKVREIAKSYQISAKEMEATIDCETGGTWDTKIQSNYLKGTPRREKSFGLAQVHLRDWPDVSYEQAIDPIFAINFMAKHFAKGEKGMWSCARLLGYAK